MSIYLGQVLDLNSIQNFLYAYNILQLGDDLRWHLITSSYKRPIMKIPRGMPYHLGLYNLNTLYVLPNELFVQDHELPINPWEIWWCRTYVNKDRASITTATIKQMGGPTDKLVREDWLHERI